MGYGEQSLIGDLTSAFRQRGVEVDETTGPSGEERSRNDVVEGGQDNQEELATTQSGSNHPGGTNQTGTQEPERRTNTQQRPDGTAEIKMGKKQGIKIASLNINGLQDRNNKRKFPRLEKKIRTERIGILALQETHATDSKVNELRATYPRLIFLTNNGPNGASQGVMFIINTEVIKVDMTKIKHTTLIQGRASWLSIEWKKDSVISITNVYAPNKDSLTPNSMKQPDFYQLLKRKLKSKENGELKYPTDIMLGDFNLVEEALDRLPPKQDCATTVQILFDIKSELKLMDGWRSANEKEIKYSYVRKSEDPNEPHSWSRLDRIYITRELYEWAFTWKIYSPDGISDHFMVATEIADQNLPFIGKGFKRIHPEDVNDTRATKEVYTVLMECQKAIETNQPTPECNPITIWLQAKEKILDIHIKTADTRRKDKLKKERKLEKDLKKAQQDNSSNVQKERAKEVERIRAELEKLNSNKLSNAVLTTKARYLAKGETCSKYWFRLKQRAPKHPNVILGLTNQEQTLTTDTQTMAEIATNHHKNLQAEQIMTPEREAAIDELLNKIDPSVKLDEQAQEILDKDMTEEAILGALKEVQNDKAPGYDGIPFEFYKEWRQKYDSVKDEQVKAKTPNIMKILSQVFTYAQKGKDIPEEFIKGLMFLLYKKKDTRDIANYRPITLLNTDYKLMTKILALRLGAVCPKIIHPDQAGFVPGRSIFDQTKFTKILIDYADMTEKDGYIVALDQEKAYDRIAHDYLWRVLEKFGIPNRTLTLIQNLYKNAKTSVILNGVIPSPFEVKRGVRQGCPMSPLIFDLAIEPLANALRKSHLKGYDIPGQTERAIAGFFADDTTVYLSKEDKFSDLVKILDLYCTASTAQFNKSKTEILPIGTKEYRQQVITTKVISNDNGDINKIPDNMIVIEDKKPMRTLGALVGNKVEQGGIWLPTMEKMNKALDKWRQDNVSYRGKRLLIKAIYLSRAQYLMTVNNMPTHIANEIDLTMKKYIWGSNKGLVEERVTKTDLKEGGLGMPDIKHMLKALDLFWGRRWLMPTNERPRWAPLVDEMIILDETEVGKDGSKVRREPCMMTDWYTQTWDTRKVRSRLPLDIFTMLETLREFRIKVDGMKLSFDTKISAPAWLNIEQSDETKVTQNRPTAVHLRHEHEVTSVGDLLDAYNGQYQDCERPHLCKNTADKYLHSFGDKFDPRIVTPRQDGLDWTPNGQRFIDSQKAMTEDEPILLNPDVTERGSYRECIRIFTPKGHTTCKNPAFRLDTEERPEGDIEERVLYTDGSCFNNGKENARCGAGIWEGVDHPNNLSIRVPGFPQSNNRGELAAFMKALETTPLWQPLLVKTDSEYVINGITTKYKEWEDTAWADVQHADIWKKTLYLVRRRTAATRIQKVKAHSGIVGNEGADDLADIGASQREFDTLDLTVPKEWEIVGARLNKLTYQQMLRLIYLTQTPYDQYRSQPALKLIKDNEEHRTGERPTTEAIWKSIRDPAITRSQSDFLWRNMHNAIKCGHHFLDCGYAQDRAFCINCEEFEVETMEHLMTKCTHEGINMVWAKAEHVWEQGYESRKYQWQKPSIADMLGIGLRTFKKTSDTEKKKDIDLGPTRLFKILVMETMWFIWRWRNKVRIERTETTLAEMLNSWQHTIATRAILDMTMIKDLEDGTKRGEKAADLIRMTWDGLVTEKKKTYTWNLWPYK